MAKPKIGDVIEITVSSGFVYAQYTHQHKQFGSLLRFFKGDFFQRLNESELVELTQAETRFSYFFMLKAAIAEGVAAVRGNFPIPQHLQGFPLFRNGIADPKTRKVAVWWLWDGENEWRVGDLTPEQRGYPLKGLIDHEYLVHLVESGWTPENDPTT